MKGSKNPFVIFVLTRVGVCGRVLQGEGHSAQCWVGCLSLANSGLTVPTVTLSSISRAPLSMGWDKTILPCCHLAMNCPKLLHIV